MSEDSQSCRGVLYVVACASPTTEKVPDVVKRAKEVGWDVCIIATPQAIKFIDVSLFERLTEHPVRSEYKRPEDPDVLPRADAIVVYPATFNTLNKWALGITDTLAVGLLCEYLGLKMPIVAVPGILTDSGLDTHPAFFRSLRMLRKYGVHVIYEPDKYPPKNQVPADVILAALHQRISRSLCEQSSKLDTNKNRSSGV